MRLSERIILFTVFDFQFVFYTTRFYYAQLGLSAFVFQFNCVSGYPLQVRRKTGTQDLHRAFHCYPAALQQRESVQHSNPYSLQINYKSLIPHSDFKTALALSTYY
jgi:hypothetical protein